MTLFLRHGWDGADFYLIISAVDQWGYRTGTDEPESCPFKVDRVLNNIVRTLPSLSVHSSLHGRRSFPAQSKGKGRQSLCISCHSADITLWNVLFDRIKYTAPQDCVRKTEETQLDIQRSHGLQEFRAFLLAISTPEKCN